MADELPHGMEAEIELTFSLRGPADAVMREVRRVRRNALSKAASLRVLVYKAEAGSGRHPPREPMTLPAVSDGDGAATLEQIDRLVRQRRIEQYLEAQLDDLVGELTTFTKREQ